MLTFIVMLMVMISSVSAEGMEGGQHLEPPINSELNYLNSILLDTGLDVDGDVYFSDAFNLYDFGTNSVIANEKMYFVISDDELVGNIHVWSENGGYNYYSSTLDDSLFLDLYRHDEAFAYGYIDEFDMLLIENMDPITLYDLSELEIDDLDYELKAIEKKYEFDPPMGTNSGDGTLISSKILDSSVYWVANQTINGKGLCWAAVMAMKVNRESSTWDSLDADDVYYLLYMHYASHGTPIGSMEWYQLGYPYFGCTVSYRDVNYSTTHYGAMSASDIMQALLDDKTIHADMYRYVVVDGVTVMKGHSVLITGLAVYSKPCCKVHIFDPNLTSEHFRIENMSYSQMASPETFVYHGLNTYTTWRKSVY